MIREPVGPVGNARESGGLAGTRTPDQCLKRALLYQLSYQPTKSGPVAFVREFKPAR